MTVVDSSSKTEKPMRVMVVDDDSDHRMLIRAILEGANYQVISAESGKSALKQLESNQVDIIITDVCMPEMNGLQLAQQLRARQTKRFVPIVLLTSGSESIDFSSTDFRADAFCLKKTVRDTLLPALGALRNDH